MHLALTAPGLWYRIALEWPGFRLVGISLPGVPLIVQGTNGAVAWGFTNLTADLSDLVLVETDPAERTAIYEDLNRRFADQAWNLWSWYTLWAIGAREQVRGLAGPALPDGGGKPFAGFGGVVPVVGLWRTGR